jgi:formamidopyrimidine-DNA glycosylase
MPALPEIEVLRRDLEKEVVGRRFKEVEVRPGSNAMKVIRRHGRRKEFQDLLLGAKVERIDRHGMYLLFELDNEHTLAVDLADTGQLVKTSGSDELVPHTHIILSFTIGGQLRVIDPKRTGEVFVTSTDELEKTGELRSTALDPLSNTGPLTWQAFSGMLEQRSVPMKALLMDERFVIGLGEIYSDEVLFAAGIRYDRASDRLTSQDVRRLYRAMMETLQDAVKARGTSGGDDDFVDLQGNSGAFQLELKVFERAGEPCRRCRNTIERAEIESHLTYYCPQCQS